VALGKNVAINITMNIIVVYPGRFHPFHRGHKASYDWLINKFGDGVYIATSDVQNSEDSPFNYADKVKMMTKLGVPSGHIVQTKNPYQAKEIVGALSDEEKQTSALVFAVSEKDASRFNFAPKKDGTPSYLQPLPENLKKLKPMTKHGYVVITPTVNFKVKGVDANSASQIRKLYLDGNEQDRINIINDLYGEPDAEIKDIFDQKLGADALDKTVTYGAEIVDGGEAKVGIMRESRVNRTKIQQLKEKIQLVQKQLQEARDQQFDYIDEKISR
jgi:hypothetical protein